MLKEFEGNNKEIAYEAKPILVAVDCIIFGFDLQDGLLKLLMIPRKLEPFAGSWSLVGSFVADHEDIDLAANRVLYEYTGLKDIFLEQHFCYGKADRDPGGRTISISYWSLIQISEMSNKLVEEHSAKWFGLDELPNLILDHKQMVDDVLSKLRIDASLRPIGFQLLPEKFTLPQLLGLYKQIYQADLDDRNFRKKILSFGVLEKLDEKDKSTSKKGSFLYRFNKENYEALAQSKTVPGINFMQ